QTRIPLHIGGPVHLLSSLCFARISESSSLSWPESPGFCRFFTRRARSDSSAFSWFAIAEQSACARASPGRNDRWLTIKASANAATPITNCHFSLSGGVNLLGIALCSFFIKAEPRVRRTTRNQSCTLLGIRVGTNRRRS